MPSSRRISATASATSASSRPAAGAALHDRHPAAEPAEHLAELQPDVAAAEHEQVLRHRVQLHDRGRVQRRHLVQPLHSGAAGRPPVLMKISVGLEHPSVHRDLLSGP